MSDPWDLYARKEALSVHLAYIHPDTGGFGGLEKE